MKLLFKILFFLFIGLSLKAQPPAPSGLPAPYSTGYYRIGWLQSDSGSIPAYRDTNWIPKFQGTTILWLHAGVDSVEWTRIGNKWIKKNSGGSGSGAVSQVANSDGSLGISPNTGNVVASLNTAHANTWTQQQTFNTFAPIFGSLTTNGGIFYGNAGGTLQQSGAGTNAQLFKSTGGSTAPIFFTPGSSDVNGWLGYTPLSNALGSSHIFVGNVSNIATDVALSGDLGISNTGVSTIQSNVVIYSKIQAAAGPGLMGATGASNFGLITLGTNLSMAGSVLNASGGSSALTNAHIFVGNASNVATDVAMSGDVGIANTGSTTIQANAVTTGKIINSAVTLPKLANGTANTLIGYDASGVPIGISLTTTGSSGPATISAGVINIPQYAGGGGSVTLTTATTVGTSPTLVGSTLNIDTLRYRKIFNVIDYGADPTGVADATVAIQAAINACDAYGGGIVHIPQGRYKIGGALNTSHNNAQIYIPAHNILTTALNNGIIIIGDPPNTVVGGGYVTGVVGRMPQTGTILISTITGTTTAGVPPSVIAADQGPNTRKFDYTDIRMQDLIIEVYTNNASAPATMAPYNMAYASSFGGEGIIGCLDTVNQKSLDPINSNVGGLYLSAVNNGGPNYCNRCQMDGFTWGYIPGEHTVLTNCYAFACDYGMMLPLNNASVTGKVLFQAVKWPIFAPHLRPIFGNTYAYNTGHSFVDMYVEIERDTNSLWYDYVGPDVIDSAGAIHGPLRILDNISTGAAQSTVFTQGYNSIAGNMTVQDQSTQNFTSPLSVSNSGGVLAGHVATGTSSSSIGAFSARNDQGGNGFVFGVYGSTFGSGYNNIASITNYGVGRISIGFNSPATSLLIMPTTGNVNITNAIAQADQTPSMFTVSSTTKGSIPMPIQTTTQINAISGPPTGLMAYDINNNGPYYYSGTAWLPMVTKAQGPTGAIQFANSYFGLSSVPTFIYDSINSRLCVGCTSTSVPMEIKSTLVSPIVWLNSTSNSTSSIPSFQVKNDAGNAFEFGMTSSTYTPSALLQPNMGFIYDAVGSILIATNATGKNVYISKDGGATAGLMLTRATNNISINSSTDNATGQLQSTSTTQPQNALHYNSTNYATMQVNSSGSLDIEHLTGLMINSGAIPTGTTTDSVLVETTLANVATVKKVAQSSLSGAVSSVTATNSTMTISPTTGAVLVGLNLANANTWTGKQTQPAPVFTGLTSAASTDSILTADASGQVHRTSAVKVINFVNGLNAPTTDSVYWGGTLLQNTPVTMGSNYVNFTSTGGLLEFNAPVLYGVNVPFDANRTIGTENIVQLKGAITANRTLTFPDANSFLGRIIYVDNGTTNSTFNWILAGSGTGSAITDPAGNTISTLQFGTSYTFVSYTQGWRILSTVTNKNSLLTSADLTAQTAAVTTVTSYAVPGSGSFNTFRVGGYITVTAVTLSPLIQLQVSWTDETSTSRTQSFFVQGTTTGISTTGTFPYSPIDIRAKQGTTITMSTTVGGTGTETYDVGANITQLY